MNKFSLFIKVKKIYISRSLMINTLCLIFISPLIFKTIFLKRTNLFDLEIVMAVFACVLVFIGVITKLYGQFNYEILKGQISGFIEFHNEKIVINNKIYEVGEIKKIEIYNGDYKGKWKSKLKTNYNNALSNGVDNLVRIIMEDEKENIDVNFLQNENFELRKVENQLVYYHKLGKIHWLHLLDILNITDYDEIQKFKNSI